MAKSKLTGVEKIGVYFCRNYIEKARERIRQVRKFMETKKFIEKITDRIEMYCNKDIEDISTREFYEFQDGIRMLRAFNRRIGEEEKIDGIDRIKGKIQERIEMYCNKATVDISIEEVYEFYEDIRMLLNLSKTRE